VKERGEVRAVKNEGEGQEEMEVRAEKLAGRCPII